MLVSRLDPGPHHRRRHVMTLIRHALTHFIIAALAVMVFHGTPEKPASTDVSAAERGCVVANS
jgi:hypothetical protein